MKKMPSFPTTNSTTEQQGRMAESQQKEDRPLELQIEKHQSPSSLPSQQQYQQQQQQQQPTTDVITATNSPISNARSSHGQLQQQRTHTTEREASSTLVSLSLSNNDDVGDDDNNEGSLLLSSLPQLHRQQNNPNESAFGSRLSKNRPLPDLIGNSSSSEDEGLHNFGGTEEKHETQQQQQAALPHKFGLKRREAVRKKRLDGTTDHLPERHSTQENGEVKSNDYEHDTNSESFERSNRNRRRRHRYQEQRTEGRMRTSNDGTGTSKMSSLSSSLPPQFRQAQTLGIPVRKEYSSKMRFQRKATTSFRRRHSRSLSPPSRQQRQERQQRLLHLTNEISNIDGVNKRNSMADFAAENEVPDTSSLEPPSLQSSTSSPMPSRLRRIDGMYGLRPKNPSSCLLDSSDDDDDYDNKQNRNGRKPRIAKFSRLNGSRDIDTRHYSNKIALHIYDLVRRDLTVPLLFGTELPVGKAFQLVNGGLHALGTGIYHCGIEVNGIEFAYGKNNSLFPTTGLFTCVPKKNQSFQYRTTIDFGNRLCSVDGHDLMMEMSQEYIGNEYDLLDWNCLTFAQDASHRLGVQKEEIPKWFRNLANTGAKTRALVTHSTKPRHLQQTQQQQQQKQQKEEPKQKKERKCYYNTAELFKIDQYHQDIWNESEQNLI